MDGVIEKPKLGRAKGKADGAAKPSGKRELFVAGAQRKTTSAMRAIRQVGKYGNPSRYQYGPDDVRKIIGALNLEVEALKTRMSEKSAKREIEFTL